MLSSVEFQDSICIRRSKVCPRILCVDIICIVGFPSPVIQGSFQALTSPPIPHYCIVKELFVVEADDSIPFRLNLKNLYRLIRSWTELGDPPYIEPSPTKDPLDRRPKPIVPEIQVVKPNMLSMRKCQIKAQSERFAISR